MKSIYRVEAKYTDPAYANQRPSVMFFRADAAEVAAYGAKKELDKQLEANGFTGVKYDISVYLSNEKEVEEYQKQMRNRVN